MITLNGHAPSLLGTSSDVKPTEDIEVNTLFAELDTGDIYYFTGVPGEEWAKFSSGGGGGSVDFFDVTFSIPEESSGECDKSFAEVVAAIEAGKVVRLFYNEMDIATVELAMTVCKSGDDIVSIVGDASRVYTDYIYPDDPNEDPTSTVVCDAAVRCVLASNNVGVRQDGMFFYRPIS